MASIEAIVQASENPDDNLVFPLVYNVSFAVGPGCPNQKDDVGLVQQLLGLVFGDLRLKLKPPVKEPIFIDGNFGPVTAAYILAFQKEARRRRVAHGITTDGQIDRARGVTGTISHTIYTILHLNVTVQRRQPEMFLPLDGTDAFNFHLFGPIRQIRARNGG